MKLYHGTSEKHLPDILKHGIRPTNVTGISNWDGQIKSKDGLVYLSTAYPMYYAFHATDIPHGYTVVAVDVEMEDLCPDEDWVARQAIKNLDTYNHPNRMELLHEVTSTVNPLLFREHAEACLNHCGSCAHIGEIPVNKITGHVTVPHDRMDAMMSLGVDTVPTEIGYRIMGPIYRNALDTLFSDGIDAAVEVYRNWFHMPDGMEV